MSNLKRIVLCFLLLTTIGSVKQSLADDQYSELRQEKLGAFARVYGYVRFFHPSDQASLVDWNQMAVFGANEILESSDDESTEKVLERIFAPLVTDLEFYRGEKKTLPETKKVPASEIVAWQHSGVGMGQSGIYRSARTNRGAIEEVKAGPFANIVQAVDANDLRGKELRFRFRAKVDQKPCSLQGWWRVDRESEEKGLFYNMGDRPIMKSEWSEYEFSGIVDDDAELLTFGVMMKGKGSGLIDDAHLEYKDDDEWKAVEISNAGFEKGKSRPEAWFGTAKGYDYVAETKDVAEGKQALRIAGQTKTRSANSGFLDVVPELGEVIDAEVGNGLRVRMPLALPVDSVYKPGDDKKVDAFVESVGEFTSEKDNVIATANVAICWSLFQHFYPYFDQVETDWDKVLVSSMKSASLAEDRASSTKSLKWLVAQLHDGHGNVIDPKEYAGMQFLPVSFQWVEDQLVVMASDDERLKAGDVVTHVDGIESKDRIASDEELISGSPQWKRFRSTSGLSQIPAGVDEVKLKLQRDDEQWEVALAPTRNRPPVPEKRPVVDRIEEGEDDGTGAIFYVDLGKAEPEQVRPMLSKFAKAKGVIYDLRGYPRGTQFLFQHMTDKHLQSAKWLVADQVHPDREDMVEFGVRGRWQMPPLKPLFKSKPVFITNGSAISYAESCMAIVANYELAPIIGSPTAGANGNINPFVLPGGYRVIYTGMRVLNHDDSQHHVVGVQPTIPLEPTIEGIREGRDELLEKAIEVVNQ